MLCVVCCVCVRVCVLCELNGAKGSSAEATAPQERRRKKNQLARLLVCVKWPAAAFRRCMFSSVPRSDHPARGHLFSRQQVYRKDNSTERESSKQKEKKERKRERASGVE
uniref:Putative secreted protein n=1 Tax=Anopheles darlingi TaxID=43151 RepID=A0A2M4D0G9_ANODA